MRRIALLIACCLLALPARPLAEGETGKEKLEPKKRVFAITIRYSFAYIPKELRNLNFWFPAAPGSELQSIHNQFIQAPYSMRTTTFEDTGNKVMHMTSGPRGGVPFTVKMAFDVERWESRHTSLEPASMKTADPAAMETLKRRWLQADSHTIIDEPLKQLADEVTSGKTGTADKARAIYDYILDGIERVDDMRGHEGLGVGNVALVLKTKKGNSIDMSAAFVGLCRAAGIPARTVIGIRIPQLPRSGLVKGYYSWAEFYLDGIGWVPVDLENGQRGGSMRDYYFGSIDESRMTISRGRDITLAPPQAGAPLNYLINPYWEGNDQAQPIPAVEITYTELDGIPDRFGGSPDPDTEPPPPQTSSR